MRNYYRVMLGKGSMYADVCRQQGFIGAGFDITQDLKDSLPENWREFNQGFFLEIRGGSDGGTNPPP